MQGNFIDIEEKIIFDLTDDEVNALKQLSKSDPEMFPVNFMMKQHIMMKPPGKFLVSKISSHAYFSLILFYDFRLL